MHFDYFENCKYFCNFILSERVAYDGAEGVPVFIFDLGRFAGFHVTDDARVEGVLVVAALDGHGVGVFRVRRVVRPRGIPQDDVTTEPAMLRWFGDAAAGL